MTLNKDNFTPFLGGTKIPLPGRITFKHNEETQVMNLYHEGNIILSFSHKGEITSLYAYELCNYWNLSIEPLSSEIEVLEENLIDKKQEQAAKLTFFNAMLKGIREIEKEKEKGKEDEF